MELHTPRVAWIWNNQFFTQFPHSWHGTRLPFFVHIYFYLCFMLYIYSNFYQFELVGNPPPPPVHKGLMIGGNPVQLSFYSTLNCEICSCYCQGFGMNGNQGGKRGDFWGGRYRSICHLSSHCWERSSCFAVSRRLQTWGCGHPERPIGRPQPLPWLRPFHGCQLLLFLSKMVEGGSKTLQEKDCCQVILPEGNIAWAFPWEHLAWGPAFPWEGETIQSKIATCSFQTVQAKYFSKNRTAHPSRCRHQEYQKCSEGLAWAGWQGRRHIWVFVVLFLQLQTGPRWGGTKCAVPPHRRDKA